MKVMTIDFTRYNPWGTIDMCSQYYVNGKRISRDEYFRFYAGNVDMCKWKLVGHEERDDVNKDGISRHYVINRYAERN